MNECVITKIISSVFKMVHAQMWAKAAAVSFAEVVVLAKILGIQVFLFNNVLFL